MLKMTSWILVTTFLAATLSLTGARSDWQQVEEAVGNEIIDKISWKWYTEWDDLDQTMNLNGTIKVQLKPDAELTETNQLRVCFAYKKPDATAFEFIKLVMESWQVQTYGLYFQKDVADPAAQCALNVDNSVVTETTTPGWFIATNFWNEATKSVYIDLSRALQVPSEETIDIDEDSEYHITLNAGVFADNLVETVGKMQGTLATAPQTFKILNGASYVQNIVGALGLAVLAFSI